MAAVFFYSSLVCLSAVTLVVFYNLFSRPVLKKRSHRASERPRVSILIPARNEASIIAASTQSALDQTYPPYEVIVLDDQSSDDTLAIVRFLQSGNRALTVLEGQALPPGWVGKNWACHQLSRKAGGDILLFMDADCFLSPWAVESIVSLMTDKKLSLFSCFPTQKMQTPGERLVVPSMNWLLLSLLPLKLVYYTSHPAIVAANGQIMAFERNAYQDIGGHETVKHAVVEDMELARQVKVHGYRMMTLLGADTLSCRMYRSFKESFRGFSKNFFPGFNTSPVIFSGVLFIFVGLFVLPYMLLFMNPLYSLHVMLILVQRMGISVLAKESALVNIVLHPIQMIIMVVIGINSMRVKLTHKILWKGRTI